MTPEDIAESRIEKARKAGETSLDLRGHGLTSLPESIGSLVKLTRLAVNDQNLTTLPESIGRLVNLQRLELRNNKLSILPESIGRMAALKWLDLSANQLTELPEVIGRLRGLEILNLAKNELAVLPESLLTLAEQGLLSEIDLNDNPDLGIPPEILAVDSLDLFHSGALTKGTNPRKVLRYYFTQLAAAIKDQTKPLNEAKILVLGEAEVGKSSLIAALTLGAQKRDFDKTRGIVQQIWKIPFDSSSLAISSKKKGRGVEELRLNVWDFGGQEIYHATHTLFLTKRSIYLIVADARANDRQNNLDHWLQMAVSFGSGAPIWVAVNKIDQHGDGPDEQHLLRKYAPHLCGFIRTSAWTGDGIDALTRRIFSEAMGMKDVRLPMPKKWLRIKSELEGMSEDTINHSDYCQLCVEQGEGDESMQSVLLDLWDKLGTVRHFHAKEDDPPAWREMSILKPEWVTKGVYAIIDAPSLQKSQGLLSEAAFYDILTFTGYPPGRHSFIEAVMRRFDLLYDTPNSNPRTMLVPQLLPEHEPPFNWPPEGTLRFVYRYDVLPAGLLPRFIARMHIFLASDTDPWRNGCVLEMKGCKARVTSDTETKEVEIEVLGNDLLRRDVLDAVRHCFEGIHALYKGLPFKEMIPAPGHKDAEMLDYQFLRKLEHVGRKHHLVNIPGADRVVEVDVRECLAGIRGSDKEREETSDRIIQNIHIEGPKSSRRKIMGDKNTITISNSTIHGDVVAGRMKECMKMIDNVEGGVKKDLLKELEGLVINLIQRLPQEQAELKEKVSKNYQTLVTEASSLSPEREWYELSAKGVIEAAKFAKDLSRELTTTVLNLGGCLWKGFELLA